MKTRPEPESAVAGLLSMLKSGLVQKVVVCRDLGPDVMPLLRERNGIELIIWPENCACEREWLIKNVPGAVGVIVMLSEKVDCELLDAAGPSLRVISTMSVGHEHVDLVALARRGIKLGYTPDVLTDAVADLSVMLALMASRNAGETLLLVQNGQWPQFTWSPFTFCGPQLSITPASPTRTMGFLGFGRIAQAVLARLIPFGVTHCLYSSNPSNPTRFSRDDSLAKKHNLRSLKRVSLVELARESDVLFVLAPGGNETKHLVNEEFSKNMRKTSIVVNTSRGSLVDSHALTKALREGWIWGAGLDVVEGEPNVTANHPLLKESRCVILPHIGSATWETRLGMATLAAKNLLAGIFGQPMPASFDLQDQGCI